jgi:bifunctional UDP-N-acetylglucosamine pyrophosphorylase/glucosamine-1-phosphate N-acetyltransferase
MEHTCAVILAAGKGTRMKSKKPKVLAELLFKPMLGYVIDACHAADIRNLCVVTGYGSDSVCEYVKNYCEEEVFNALQQEQKGTGHAVMMTKEFLKQNRGGDVCVMCGDTPFLSGEVIANAYRQHKAQHNAVTIVTATLENPFGYGRIVRDEDRILRIVEEKDANDAEKAIKEINSGVYWFQIDNLLEQLENLKPNNAQGEYYLTDTVALTIAAGRRVGGCLAENSDVILGANSRKDLYQLNEILRKSVISRLMDEGVSFASTDGVLISPDAKIGCDTMILGGTVIKEEVVIGEDCVIGPNTLIQKSTIGDRVKLNSVQCYQSKVHSDTDIGPFVHIRPNSEIHSHVHIGDFVEVKNSTIGAGTGISHLTYVGDSDVGKNVNFGCGVVTVNYDGVHKHRCVIEDEAFIGCNTNLVAPVHIGKSAYTAAGSTITKDVEDYALAIARNRQEIKSGFAAKKLAGRKKKV